MSYIDFAACLPRQCVQRADLLRSRALHVSERQDGDGMPGGLKYVAAGREVTSLDISGGVVTECLAKCF